MSVVVLFGGDGSEHRVSVASAQNVASLLDDAALWFWRLRGDVVRVERGELLAFARPFETDFHPAPLERWPGLAEALQTDGRGSTFFLALHGGSGEDGTVQGILEANALPFTGSGSAASRLAFDKHRARQAVGERGVAVADATVVTRDASTHERLGRLFELHHKIVVKPLADGSSHGLAVVTNERELSAAIEAVQASGVPHLAEAFVSGTELTVGVIDGEGGVRALPCSEVRLDEGRTFDFEGKYLGRGTLEVTPAEVSESAADAARSVALTAHRTLGCAGYSRTDVILGPGGPVFLETNTLPGLTRASFIPQQLEAAGIAMETFVSRQLEIARQRLAL